MRRKRLLVILAVAAILLPTLIIAAMSGHSAFFPSQSSSQTSCGTEIIVNGTDYCSFNLTQYLDVVNPGYSVLSAPVTFMSVKFNTVCPENTANCPGNQTERTQVQLRIVIFNLTFPDNSSEQLSAALPDAGGPYYYITVHHSSPSAGFMTEVESGSEQVFALVQP